MTVPTGVPLEPADVYPRSETKLRSAVTPDVPQLPVEHRANVAGHGTSALVGPVLAARTTPTTYSGVQYPRPPPVPATTLLFPIRS